MAGIINDADQKDKTNPRRRIRSNAKELLKVIQNQDRIENSINIDFTKQAEFNLTHSEDKTVGVVSKYLSNSVNYQTLSTDSKFDDLSSSASLIRFKGNFSPCLDGENTADLIANMDEAAYIQWAGYCGDVKANFITSKESMVSRSPIMLSISSGLKPIALEGFATISGKIDDKAEIDLLPLFIGVFISDIKL